jgi:hypothetical protein
MPASSSQVEAAPTQAAPTQPPPTQAAPAQATPTPPAENICTVAIESHEKTILAKTPVEIEGGMTVFDALKAATRANRMHMEFSGNGKTAYVKGIDNLYEFDNGAASGWIYSVNGEYQGIGCGLCEIKGGDSIVWRYTLDLGADIGAAVGV